MDTEINVATAAEKRPVYDQEVLSRREAQNWMIETDKYKDSVGVRFPVLYHFLIFFSRHFQVHGENMPGAVSKIWYAGGCLFRRQLGWWVLSDTYLSGGWISSEGW